MLRRIVNLGPVLLVIVMNFAASMGHAEPQLLANNVVLLAQDRTIGEQLQSNICYDDLSDIVGGRGWDYTKLTYFFQKGTGNIVGSNEHQATHDVFRLWNAVKALTFKEVTYQTVYTASESNLAWECELHIYSHRQWCIRNLRSYRR